MSFTERQNEIIDKAVRLIADRGIQQLTIKNIAMAMKITEPAIYRHFTGKAAILSAILDLFESVSAGVMDEILAAELPPLEKIGGFIRDRYRRLSEYPPLAKVMFAEELFQDDPALAERILQIMHRHGKALAGLIAEGQTAGEIRNDIEPRTLFRLIMGPVRLLIKQWGLSGYGFDLAEEGERMWAAMRKLIAAPEPEGKDETENY